MHYFWPAQLHTHAPTQVSSDEQLDAIRLRCDAPQDVVAKVAAFIKFDLKQYEKEAS